MNVCTLVQTQMEHCINCIANIGLACELIYAVDPTPWAYDIRAAIAATNGVIKFGYKNLHALMLGLCSLVTYQLIDPSKVVIDWIKTLKPLADIDILKSGKIMLEAQLSIINQNLDALSVIRAYEHYPHHHGDMLDLHRKFHVEFNAYCEMVQPHLTRLIVLTDAAILGNVTQLIDESLNIAYFMIAFNPMSYLIPLHAPSDYSPNPTEQAMRDAIDELKTCMTEIVTMAFTTPNEPQFGTSLQSFCTFVYSTGLKASRKNPSTTLATRMNVDMFLFGRYCYGYYELVATLHIDHVKIAQELWLALIALMYRDPEIFEHDQDNNMRYTILTGGGDISDKIEFLHARIYVAAGALAPLKISTARSRFVERMIICDKATIQKITDSKTVTESNKDSEMKLSSDEFIAILTSIQRSLIIRPGNHICDKYSWCYACKTIHRAQDELARARNSKFRIAMSDDKRVLAQIQYEKDRVTPSFTGVPVVTLPNGGTRILRITTYRDLDIFD